MAKITISKSGQGIITIPKEIMEIKRWNNETEILISPFFPEPKSNISEDTPIVITEIKKQIRKE